MTEILLNLGLVFLASLRISHNLSEWGFWVFVAVGVCLVMAAAYQFFKSRIPEKDSDLSEEEEEELNRYDETFLHFLKFIPAPVAMFDSELRYMAVSDRWLEDFGIKDKQVIGKSFFEVIPTLSDEWKDILQTSLTGISQTLEEEPLIKEDGTTEWLHCDIHPWYRAEDEVGGLIMFSEIITQRKETEDALKKAKELAEEASRSKSNFIAKMSHELKTPLTSILGYAEMLEIDSDMAREQLNQVLEIKKSGEHLLDMISDILELSKIETDQIRFTGQKFDLSKLIQTLVKLKSERYAEHKNRVEVEDDEGMPSFIHTDKEKVRTIVENLVDNAFKYTREGIISISTEVINVKPGTVDEVNSILRITITNSGEPIPVDKMEYIFKPFTQIGQQYNRGTGLGLSLAQRLAQFLGGKLTVESEEEKGTSFTLKIPVQVTPESAKSEQSERDGETEKVKEELSAKEVSDFINSLNEESFRIVSEALELQDMDTLSHLDEELNLEESEKNGAIAKLKACAENFDYLFITQVNKELQSE